MLFLQSSDNACVIGSCTFLCFSMDILTCFLGLWCVCVRCTGKKSKVLWDGVNYFDYCDKNVGSVFTRVKLSNYCEIG